MTVEGVDVCVAECVGDDFDAYFAGFGGVDGDLFFCERLLGTAGYHSGAGDGLACRSGEIRSGCHGDGGVTVVFLSVWIVD